MPVKREGGMRISGDDTPVGQPSPTPGVRSDVQAFNVPFDRDKFTQQINRHGYNVTWEKAMYCPQLKGPSPTQHDINCQLCNQGFLFIDPVKTKMLFTSVNLSQQFYAYGRFDSGRAQVSAFPEFKMSFWDRVTLHDSRSRFQELVKRQRGTLSDRLKYQPLSIVLIVWSIGDNEVAQGVPDVDYRVDDDTGNIIWLTANRPGADTFYSISYFFRPRYIVQDVLHNVRDMQIPKLDDEDKNWEFPVQVVAQMDQFIRDEGLDPSNESDTKNPFPTQSQDLANGA